MAFDCTRCGACCCNPDENRAEGFVEYVEVLPGDRLWRSERLVKRLVVIDASGAGHLRLDGDRCAALRGRVGRRVECTIYVDRPRACQRVEAGSARCVQARRERGVDRDTH